METYEKLEKKLDETKMYAKRVMDLYCDAIRWRNISKYSDNPDTRQRYMNVSNMLMDLFNNEMETLKYIKED